MVRTAGSTGLPNLSIEDDGIEETKLSTSSAVAPSAPAPLESAPYLIPIGRASSSQVVALLTQETLIGRAQDCVVRLDEHGVSRMHARVTREGNDYTIEDLGSSNGTFLNGNRIQGKYRLTSGDRIRVGPSTILRFEWPSDIGDDAPSSPTTTLRRTLTTERWSPTSWQHKSQKHLPTYAEPAELDGAIKTLANLPPLVTSWEIDRLKSLIAEAQNGDRFLLQGGDCAETIADCQASIIRNKLKILLQMSLILTHAARKPVIRVGRFAGQYAKPRSKPTEVRDGLELPSYVGDLVNRPEFTPEARRPDPKLLLSGYYHASLTLNFIRSLCAGGFSDLRQPEYFDLTAFERHELPTDVHDQFTRMSRQVSEGLHFLRAMGDRALDELARVDFYASHEGLNLMYESAQTRQAPRKSGWYCMTTHLPWIGERTRDITGAHVEFFRGINNPVGVKIGPAAAPKEVVELLSILNPDDEPGKIVLIVRMGAGNVPKKLPPLIEAVARARRRVLWVSDPMHGNGMVTKTGIKTRDFGAILQEIEETFETHEKCGSRFGGAHLELTGDDVTECIGAGLSEADLDTRYLTACDPRLNYRQAMEIAFLIARRIGSSSVRRVSSRPPPG